MSFYLTDVKVRMPIFGLIAKNSRNFQLGRPGWMNAEEKLCIEYKKYVSQLSKEKFLQRIEYMKHAGDLGRTPMGTGLKIFLFLLVAAESMGFSYILGTWAATEGSTNLYTKLMFGIVFVLASILAIVTHAAGAQFYRTSLIRSCFARHKESRNKEFHSTRVISLSDDQFADAKDPPETRCVNRIIDNPHDMGSYGWCWVAGIFVALIFVLSGVMRYSHMEAELTRQAQAQDVQSGNPFPSSALPADLTEPQKKVDKKANDEAIGDAGREGGAAIIILGVIFVVTQIVGFGAGHKHCFAGKETYKKAEGTSTFWWWSEMDGAFADTWGYSTYDSYWEAMQPIKDIVNSRLKDLQQVLEKNSPKHIGLDKTFEDFLAMQALLASHSQQLHNQAQQLHDVVQMPVPAQAPPPFVPAAQDGALERAKASIEAFTDKAQQQDYFVTLPADVREALKPWLKERKERAAVAPTKAELDELF